MGLLQVGNCLCCKLKTGILVLGWIGIVECVIAIVALLLLWFADFSSFFESTPKYKEQSPEELDHLINLVKVFCIVFIIIYIIAFIMCVILIKGVNQV